jgi:hypothetical protein
MPFARSEYAGAFRLRARLHRGGFAEKCKKIALHRCSHILDFSPCAQAGPLTHLRVNLRPWAASCSPCARPFGLRLTSDSHTDGNIENARSPLLFHPMHRETTSCVQNTKMLTEEVWSLALRRVLRTAVTLARSRTRSGYLGFRIPSDPSVRGAAWPLCPLQPGKA